MIDNRFNLQLYYSVFTVVLIMLALTVGCKKSDSQKGQIVNIQASFVDDSILAPVGLENISSSISDSNDSLLISLVCGKPFFVEKEFIDKLASYLAVLLNNRKGVKELMIVYKLDEKQSDGYRYDYNISTMEKIAFNYRFPGMLPALQHYLSWYRSGMATDLKISIEVVNEALGDQAIEGEFLGLVYEILDHSQPYETRERAKRTYLGLIELSRLAKPESEYAYLVPFLEQLNQELNLVDPSLYE